MTFTAANDTAAQALAFRANLSAPHALVCTDEDAGSYELRPLLGCFADDGWMRGDDYEPMPEGNLTVALARFAPISPDERLVRIA